MYIEKRTKTIHLRMGNKFKFISSIILNDGTKLVNMQCSSIYPRPTNKQLRDFENKVNDTFYMTYDKLKEAYEMMKNM